MTENQQEQTVICQVCRQPKPLSEVLPAELVRDSVEETIQKGHPD